MLGRMRRSGTLHIECPQRLVDVHFAKGRIAETRDSTRVAADTVIGSQLLKRSLVNDQQLAVALKEQEARPRPVGTILVDHGAVAEGLAARGALPPDRQHARGHEAWRRRARSSSSSTPSRRRPTASRSTRSPCCSTSPPSAGSTAWPWRCWASRRPCSCATATTRRSLATRSRWRRDEFVVLLQVDGQRTVTEITAASRLEEITVVNILAKLADAGVLLVKAERQSRAEDASELRAHRDSVWAEVSHLLDDIVEVASPAREAPARPATRRRMTPARPCSEAPAGRPERRKGRAARRPPAPFPPHRPAPLPAAGPSATRLRRSRRGRGPRTR